MKWPEIRCTDCNAEGFWAVDAWETENDAEEGRVIAYIDDLTARVIYIDPLARVDEHAQEVIKEKINDIKENNEIVVIAADDNHAVGIRMKTAAGILTLDALTKDSIGQDEMFVGLIPKGFDSDYIDLAGVKIETDEKYFKGYLSQGCEVRIFAFDDPSTEDYTWDSWISDGQIAEALKIDEEA